GKRCGLGFPARGASAVREQKGDLGSNICLALDSRSMRGEVVNGDFKAIDKSVMRKHKSGSGAREVSLGTLHLGRSRTSIAVTARGLPAVAQNGRWRRIGGRSGVLERELYRGSSLARMPSHQHFEQTVVFR